MAICLMISKTRLLMMTCADAASKPTGASSTKHTSIALRQNDTVPKQELRNRGETSQYVSTARGAACTANATLPRSSAPTAEAGASPPPKAPPPAARWKARMRPPRPEELSRGSARGEDGSKISFIAQTNAPMPSAAKQAPRYLMSRTPSSSHASPHAAGVAPRVGVAAKSKPKSRSCSPSRRATRDWHLVAPAPIAKSNTAQAPRARPSTGANTRAVCNPGFKWEAQSEVVEKGIARHGARMRNGKTCKANVQLACCRYMRCARALSCMAHASEGASSATGASLP
mmetsp:Transcript_27320/g.90814  ORF Transcript_27320/g.90814 Transcript_27320/m.90814 type:complete len:286 (-) Transcript_27320:188-1045(-)